MFVLVVLAEFVMEAFVLLHLLHEQRGVKLSTCGCHDGTKRKERTAKNSGGNDGFGDRFGSSRSPRSSESGSLMIASDFQDRPGFRSSG